MKSIVLTLLLGSLSLPLAAQEIPGTESGNGGDWLVTLFYKHAYRILHKVEKQNLLSSIDILRLKDLLTSMKIETQKDLPKDAFNFPRSKRLVLDEDKWTIHFEKNHNIDNLVFHELLPFLNTNDQNYAHSSKLDLGQDSLVELSGKDRESCEQWINQNLGLFSICGPPDFKMGKRTVRNFNVEACYQLEKGGHINCLVNHEPWPSSRCLMTIELDSQCYRNISTRILNDNREDL